MNDTRVHTYLPVENPVLAAQYRDPDDLVAIQRWVGVLRDRGLIPPAVRTTVITSDDDEPARLVVSMPADGGEDSWIMRLGSFVAFQVGRLTVLDGDDFRARFRPLPNPIADTSASATELGVQHCQAQHHGVPRGEVRRGEVPR